VNRFEDAYRGVPPWDIGRPQPAVVRLADEGLLRGAVLDAGCGTGENALFLAGRGADVAGVDFVAAAVQRAREKARERELHADFRVLDALRLAELGWTFDAVLDCGLFHTFGDDERPRYAAAVASVLRAGGALHLMCFSEEERSEGGPRRVTQAEIRAAFGNALHVDWIRAERFESHLHAEGARAWLARLVRGSGPP
jgi:cyclopropane fatty-acyl-phospholipid synthase-like methyltransferase